jgi:hypothetical protein
MDLGGGSRGGAPPPDFKRPGFFHIIFSKMCFHGKMTVLDTFRSIFRLLELYNAKKTNQSAI